MNAVWMSTPLAAALARTLIHSLWEGTAVAAVLAVTLCLIRSPRSRYGAACVAIVLLLCSFGVTLSRQLPDASAPILSIATNRTAVTLPSNMTPTLPAIPRASDDPTWLVPLWLVGFILFHLKGLASWLSARRLRRTGVCAVPELWLHRLTHLQTKLQMNRSVALLESCLAEVPVVIGYIRPVILMPIGLLAGLPAGQVEAILLHELAHIRRYDYLVNLAQVFVEGILFYHPAVWWISGVMRVERENCCDDLVVEVTGGAHEFASALTALEHRRANPTAALAATDGSLVKRIHRLLRRPTRNFAPALPLPTALILVATAVTSLAALQQRQTVLPEATKTALSTLPPVQVPEPVILAQARPAPEAAAPRTAPPAPPAAPIIQEPALHSFTVEGAVKNPGQFEFDGSITLLEALAKAGSTTDDAGPDVLLTAPDSETPRRISIEALQLSAGPIFNVILTGGETVSVPSVVAVSVWVTGNVTYPSRVPFKKPEDATVLKTIARAEGLTQYYGHIAYIYRPDKTGIRREIPVPLFEMVHHRLPDVRLQPDDILLIPNQFADQRRQLQQLLNPLYLATPKDPQ